MNNNCVQPFVQYSSHTLFITGIMTSACFFSHIGKVETTLETMLRVTKRTKFCNCATKGVVQGMGANKIANAIMY